MSKRKYDMEKEHIYNYIWIQHAKKIVKKIIQKETDYEKLTAEELKTKTRYFRCQYQTTKRLDTLLVDAFAAVREAAFRTTGMKPYPVQIVGGIGLHEGKIAQMCTGEGKTLVCTMPAYLNALVGKGVHIVTVNDYLAQRDAEKMGPIFEYLGLSVGVVLSDTSPVMKKEAYACDITYLTNTALGFDYLRDNMATEIEQVVQRGHHYAIIDEVDSILIDEAKTPLIISGEGKDASTYYLACDALAKQMVQGRQSKEFNKMDALVGELPEETGDFIVHEKEKTVTLTEQGVEKVKQRFGIENYGDVHFLSVIQGIGFKSELHHEKGY
jgi:preprotein translocase subunit SecA